MNKYFCVDKESRKKGIGKELIDSIKNKKWSIIELCCHLDDIDVINFIEKCNFIPSKQITSWYYKLNQR